MIQRIQSVYVSLALILLGLMAWLPLGELAVNNELYSFTVKGISNQLTGDVIQNGLPVMILLGLIIGLQIAVLFGFKKRIRQMRIATYNIILMIGLLGVSWYFVQSSLKEIGAGVYVFKIALAFPLVAAILNYLAIRAIGRDEALVKSIDRIR